MAVITIVSKLLGFVRDIVLGAIYGTGPELTAFMAASKLPFTLFDTIVGGVITAALIPVFNAILVKYDKKKAFDFANQYINLILVITSMLTVVGVIFAEPLVRFTLSGPAITPETITLAVSLTRIMFGSIIFTGVAYSFVGMLQSNGQFYIASILSLISNGLVIVYLGVVGDGGTMHALACVMLIGWAMQVAIQLPSIWKYGYRYKPTLKFKTPEMLQAIKLSGPILVSSWAQPLASLINVRMASYLNGGGAVVAIELANRLYIVIAGVFGYVISNLAYPYLSKVAVEEDKEALKGLVQTLVKSITFIIAPIMVGLILLALPITQIAYGRGAFTPEDARLTGTALMSMSFGMLAFSYNEILNKTFYAMNNSRIPMYTAIVGMLTNIVLSLVLPAYYGIAGLGLAIATGTVLTALLNFMMLGRKLPGYMNQSSWMDLSKMLLATIVMGMVVVFVKQQVTNDFLQVIVATIVGGSVYLVMSILFQVSIIKMILDVLKSRLKKGGNDGE